MCEFSLAITAECLYISLPTKLLMYTYALANMQQEGHDDP